MVEMNYIMEVNENETFNIKKRSLPHIDGSCPQLCWDVDTHFALSIL
jgi:hypothetical protein